MGLLGTIRLSVFARETENQANNLMVSGERMHGGNDDDDEGGQIMINSSWTPLYTTQQQQEENIKQSSR